jgi:hypothetical protein
MTGTTDSVVQVIGRASCPYESDCPSRSNYKLQLLTTFLKLLLIFRNILNITDCFFSYSIFFPESTPWRSGRGTNRKVAGSRPDDVDFI